MPKGLHVERERVNRRDASDHWQFHTTLRVVACVWEGAAGARWIWYNCLPGMHGTHESEVKLRDYEGYKGNTSRVPLLCKCEQFCRGYEQLVR